MPSSIGTKSTGIRSMVFISSTQTKIVIAIGVTSGLLP